MTSTAAIAFASIGFLSLAAAMPAGAQDAAAIPDFSGIWAHLTWPDVAPPPAGPGPVRNMSRRNGVSNNYQLVGDYANPILKPEAAQVDLKKKFFQSAHYHADRSRHRFRYDAWSGSRCERLRGQAVPIR